MAALDKDVNAALDLFNQRCLSDPAFAKFAEENPIGAFDQMMQTHTAEAAQLREAFPLETPGRRLSLAELEMVRTDDQ